MNALDSPLEVLAFDYLSFGLLTAVNNVWTWVAVLTAAVSVWRFRSSSPRGKCPDEASLITTPVVSSSSPVERAEIEASTSTSTQAEEAAARRPSAAAAPSSPPCAAFNSEGRTSGKFTFYYDREEEEDDVRNDEGNGKVDGDDGNVEGEKEYCWLRDDGWEVTMRMRMWDDMGFYRYQDSTVLDGSVVRLWEGCRRRSGSGAAAPLIRCGGGEGCMMW